jgi:hypothetical protein
VSVRRNERHHTKETAVRIFLWYIAPGAPRIIGEGSHVQDAFARLNDEQRSRIPFAEFCVEITSGVPHRNAPYARLLEVYKARREGRESHAHTFHVRYETRQRGAIGIFEPRSYRVEAETTTGALQIAFEMAQAEGLETRFPLSVLQEGPARASK